jgi:tetratricopeptide (TPR) repeat protein
MNVSLRHPLYSIKTFVAEGVLRTDPRPLAECLRGNHLPALGGDQHPAELIYQALILPPVDPRLLDRVIRAVAVLCEMQAAELRAGLGAITIASQDTIQLRRVGQVPAIADELFLYNLLLFASFLPADPAVFAALKDIRDAGLPSSTVTTGMGRAARQLRQALTVHQVDESLKEFWFALIGDPEPHHRLSADRKTDLLDAWTGLVWMAPNDETRAAGKTPSIGLIDQGLLALHSVVGDSSDGLALLRYAIGQLDDTHPRAPEFWVEHLRPCIARWPPLLRDVVMERWPTILTTDGIAAELLDKDCLETWNLVSPPTRDRILKAAREKDLASWWPLWQEVFFLEPPPETPRQQWISSLRAIRAAFEARWTELRARPAQAPADEDLSYRETDRRPPVHLDRLAEYERVTRAIAAIEARLADGDLVMAKRFLDDLIRHQEASKTEPPLIAKTLCNVGSSAADAGHFDWATSLYFEARTRAPGDPVPYSGLAEVFRLQGDYERAETLYREAATLFPDDIVTLDGLAEVLRKQGKYPEAEALYRETAERFPNDVVAHNGLAEVLRERGEYAHAESLYRQTAARFPNDVFAHNGLAGVLREQGKYAEGEALYRETAARFPNNVVTHNGLAELLREQLRYAEAEALYRETAVRFPNDPFARNGLAEALRELGRYGEAEALYAETAARFPNSPVPHSGLAEVLREQGKYAAAEALYRETAARFPHDLFSRNGLAEVLREQGRYTEAEALYRETAMRFPNNVFAHNGLAAVLREQERYAEAESTYREAALRFPYDRVIRHGLSNLLRLQGRFDQALALLPMVSDITNLQDAYDLHLRGMILLETGQTSTAVSIFRRGLRANVRPRQLVYFRTALAVASIREGRFNEARQELAAVPDRTPEVEAVGLHATAALGETSHAREIYSDLASRLLSFRRVTARAVDTISVAWGLRPDLEPRQPTEQDTAKMIAAEIEMLAAA